MGDEKRTAVNPDRLNGWKEIAAYVGKEERTAQRWEKRGMPVHRVGALDGVVYAFGSEIDRWSATSKLDDASAEATQAAPLQGGHPAGRPAPIMEQWEEASEEPWAPGGRYLPGPSTIEGSPANGPSAVKGSHVDSAQGGPDLSPANDAKSFPEAQSHGVPGGRYPIPLAWGVGLLVLCAAVIALARLPGPPSGATPLALRGPARTIGSQGQNFVFTLEGAAQESGELWRWMRAPDGRETRLEPRILPDANGRIVWALSTDCLTPSGRHDVAFVDVSGRHVSSVVSIEVQRDARCTEGVADLVAEAVHLDPVTPPQAPKALGRFIEGTLGTQGTQGMEVEAGGHVVCRFVLRNHGRRRAVSSLTRLRLGLSDARSAVTDLSLGDVPAPALASGEVISVEHRFVIPAQVAPGRYYVWVVADNGGANLETASHNNFARSTALTVLPPSPVPPR